MLCTALSYLLLGFYDVLALRTVSDHEKRRLTWLGRIKLYVTWCLLRLRRAHAETFLGGSYRALEVTIARHITFQRKRRHAAALRDRLRQAFQPVLAARGQCHLGPRTRQLQRQLFADAGRSAGDQHHFVLEVRNCFGHRNSLYHELTRSRYGPRRSRN